MTGFHKEEHDMRLTIGVRLAAGFGAVLAVALTLGGIIYTNAQTSVEVMHTTIEEDEDVVLASEAAKQIQLTRIQSKNFHADNQQESYDKFKKSAETAQAKLKELAEHVAGTDEGDEAAAITKLMEEYSATFEQAAQVIRDRNAIITKDLIPSLERLQKAIANLGNSSRNGADAARAECALALVNADREVRTSMRTGTPEQVEHAKQELANLVKTVVAAGENAEDADVRAEITAALALARTASDDYDRVAEFVKERHELVEGKLDKLGPQFGDASDKLVAGIQKHIDALCEQGIADLKRTKLMGLVITAIGLFIGVGVSIYITTSVRRPLAAIAGKLALVAQGDLTTRVDESRKDELGDLARSFNTCLGKIHDVVREVSMAANEVAAAATEIAASNEEMSAAVTEVNHQCTQATTAASSAQKGAEDGGGVVSKTIGSMSEINDAANTSAECVTELFKRSEQIGTVIGVITDIADQTNLLALNAAIEAARAGEHGRGFAVVADEVRKLAERTTTATEEVAQSIKAIQGKTTEAVEIMNGSKKSAEQGASLSAEAGDKLGQIVRSSQEVAALITQIATATEQVGAGVTQSASASGQLSTKAEELRVMVSKFKVNAAG